MERATREVEIDPVCGEEVHPDNSEYYCAYDGKTYRFCCLGCQWDFEEAPEKFVGPYA